MIDGSQGLTLAAVTFTGHFQCLVVYSSFMRITALNPDDDCIRWAFLLLDWKKRKWRLRLGVFTKNICTWLEPGFSSLIVELIGAHISDGLDKRGETLVCPVVKCRGSAPFCVLEAD